MVMPLDRDQAIAAHVLGGDVPRFTDAFAAAADAETLSLPDGVEHEALVASQDLPFGGADLSGVIRQVAVEELAERALPDKADAGGVLLVVVGQPFASRDFAHVALVEPAEREQRAGELGLIQAVEEIALVLGAVFRLQQLEEAVGFAHLGIVAGGDEIGAEADRVVEKSLELDFGIAQHVGIGCAACPVLPQEIAEHALLVLPG